MYFFCKIFDEYEKKTLLLSFAKIFPPTLHTEFGVCPEMIASSHRKNMTRDEKNQICRHSDTGGRFGKQLRSFCFIFASLAQFNKVLLLVFFSFKTIIVTDFFIHEKITFQPPLTFISTKALPLLLNNIKASKQTNKQGA